MAPGRSHWVDLAAVGAIVAVAAVLRLWDLEAFPPPSADEGTYLEQSRSLLQGQFRVFDVQGLLIQPPLAFLLGGVAMTLFGEGYLSLRALSALFGVGSVLLLWLLGWRLYGRGVATGAALLLAIHPGVVATNRIFITDNVMAFLYLATLLMATAHEKRRTLRSSLAVGTLAGLTVLAKLWGLVGMVTVVVWLYLGGDRARHLLAVVATATILGAIYPLLAWAWAPSTFSIVGGEAAREWGSFSFVLVFLEDPLILAAFAATLAVAGGLGERASRSDLLVVGGVLGWVLIFAIFHYRFYYVVEYAPLMFLMLSRTVVHGWSRFQDQPGRSLFLLLLVSFPPFLWALTNGGLGIAQARVILLGTVIVAGVALLLARTRVAELSRWMIGAVLVAMVVSPLVAQVRSWDQVIQGRYFGRAYYDRTASFAELAAAAIFLRQWSGEATSVVANPLLLAQLPSDMSRRGRPYQWAPPWGPNYPDYAVVDDLWRRKYLRPAVEFGTGVPPPVAGWPEVFRSGTVAVFQNPATLP